MRRIRLIPALLVFLLSACSESVIQQWPDKVVEGEGIVRIALDTDMSNMTKADAEKPNLDDFRVAIYAGDTKMRLYNDSYANAKNAQIKLNAKEHRLIAQHGDSLGCGFNKPYYLADETFTVIKGENTVDAVAKLANVKIAVKYDATITGNYSDYKVVVKHNTHTGKTLTFNKGETRYGYMPGGEFTLEIMALIDGVWKVYSTVPGIYQPNDFVTFTITADASEGSMTINITVDSTVEDKNDVVEIPAYTVPQDAPEIILAGFDGTGNIHEFVEGVAEGNNATATFVARGSLKSCILDINSDYLKEKGLPSEIDFANVSSDLKVQLKAAGFVWDEDMMTSRTFSWIDFSGVIANMYRDIKSSTQDAVVAGFSLKVTDAVNKEATTSFSIVSGAVKATLEVKDYNVWAKKIVDPVVTINKGNVSLVKLQYSLDKRNWSDFNVTPSQSSYALTYDVVPVSPGTTYHLRAIYNGNTDCASPIVTVTTEDAAQLGNSDFEDYQTVQQTVNRNPGTYTRYWYLPYASGETDVWWACNSKKSMPSSHVYAANPTCKNFPTSGYVKDSYHGSKSAVVFTADVSWDNTASTLGTNHNEYEGELWIGKADDGGNRVSESDGHAFNSRPSKMNFHYKYEQKNSETFYVEAWIKDSSGNIIATAKETQGKPASTWTKYELPFTYLKTNVKASKIFVLFRSCNGNGEVTVKKTIELGEESYEAHIGSIFKIDKIELVYE